MFNVSKDELGVILRALTAESDDQVHADREEPVSECTLCHSLCLKDTAVIEILVDTLCTSASTCSTCASLLCIALSRISTYSPESQVKFTVRLKVEKSGGIVAPTECLTMSILDHERTLCANELYTSTGT